MVASCMPSFSSISPWHGQRQGHTTATTLLLVRRPFWELWTRLGIQNLQVVLVVKRYNIHAATELMQRTVNPGCARTPSCTVPLTDMHYCHWRPMQMHSHHQWRPSPCRSKHHCLTGSRRPMQLSH